MVSSFQLVADARTYGNYFLDNNNEENRSKLPFRTSAIVLNSTREKKKSLGSRGKMARTRSQMIELGKES